jgi:predicted amidohydrolase
MKVAAVQFEPVIADLAENLRRCRVLGDEAGRTGAEWIILPEFFTTGMGFIDAIADAALPPDGAGLQLLQELARRHGATVGGSFICRHPDGDNRNTWFLVGPDGELLGQHDKDLPTMWENAFYIGGQDDGVIDAAGLPVGVAMCWETMRTQTVRRLRGRVDLIVGGSAWWSIPPWPPASLTTRLEAANARTSAGTAPAIARAVGVPIVYAALCGPVSCPMPWLRGLPYRGHYQGGACITDARGGVVAWRGPAEGPGIVVADIEPGRITPTLDVPETGFWLHPRGAMAAATWAMQNAHGRRWYPRHARGRPANPATLDELTLGEVPATAKRTR